MRMESLEVDKAYRLKISAKGKLSYDGIITVVYKDDECVRYAFITMDFCEYGDALMFTNKVWTVFFNDVSEIVKSELTYIGDKNTHPEHWL